MIYKMQSGEDFAIQTKGGGRIIVPNVVAEPQFNPTSAYAVDAKVWYGSVQYICTTGTTEPEEGQSNPTPEEDTAHWAEIPVEEMAKRSEIPSIPVAPVHELFLNARADVWLSAGDGDDANDGLAPDRAVKSIARAYAAAKAAVDAQTLDGSRQVVVAVDEGVYAAAMITSELASGIRYSAVGDRERTLVMPMGGTYGPSGAYETAMACVNGEHPRVFEMEGFTFTGFNGNHHLAIAQYQSGIVYGMTLRRCLITGNSPICTKAFVCGTFIDCDITGNTTRPAGNTGGDAPFGGSSAVYDDRERYQTRMYSCHVWDNDFSTFQYFANKIEAKQCLFENSFAAVKAIHGEHNTMIADRYTNPLIPPSSTYKKFFAMGAKYFAVIASSADSTSDPFYVETDAYVCVQTANLTEDKVAADASCPSVRSDGSPDFGYRDSGLGLKKTASSVVKTPVYDGQNHAFLSATNLVPGEDFTTVTTEVLHRWTMPRKGIVYIRLMSNQDSSTVRIGVNVAAGAVDVDNEHCVTVLSNLKDETSAVVPLFLNAGDEVCLSVSSKPLQFVLFSCFYTD